MVHALFLPENVRNHRRASAHLVVAKLNAVTVLENVHFIQCMNDTINNINGNDQQIEVNPTNGHTRYTHVNHKHGNVSNLKVLCCFCFELTTFEPFLTNFNLRECILNQSMLQATRIACQRNANEFRYFNQLLVSVTASRLVSPPFFFFIFAHFRPFQVATSPHSIAYSK